MKTKAIEILACQQCRAPLAIQSIANEEAQEIISGVLECGACKARYPIVDGVPEFLGADDRASHVARSFGFEWQMHHDGGFEDGKVFGRSVDEDIQYFLDAFGLSEEDMKDKIVLDAGCGSGRLTVALARRYPQCTFVGVDFNPAIYEIAIRNRALDNLYLVRSSVLTIPVNDGTFDLVWSNGVIHHTGATRVAFDAVIRTVKPGGKAYIWVYEDKVSLPVGVRKLLTPLGLKYWNHHFLYRLCQLLSLPTWVAVKLMGVLGRIPGAQRHTHMKILSRNRGYQELVLTWFDCLSPEFRDTYSKAEVESWFVANGFYDLRHYWWPVGVCGIRRQFR